MNTDRLGVRVCTSIMAAAAGLLLWFPVQAAQVPCTPSVGFSRCVRITYAGVDQAFTIPASITRVQVKAWGAGGGGGDRGGAFQFGTGGGGAYASGTLTVVPGDVLTVVVGQAGLPRSTAPTYGGGGGGGANLGDFRVGASGGGRSAIRLAGADVLTAAGGGGSAAASTIRVAAGAGGQDAITGNGCVIPARAGSAVAGGRRALGGPGAVVVEGTDGSALQGGTGGVSPSGNSGSGGGGGGGFFGGGGGHGQRDPGTCQDSSGAGGANFAAPAVTAAVLTTGNLQTPANAADALRGAGIGNGAVGLAAGGNGEVIVQWQINSSLSVTKTNTPAAGAQDQTGDTVAAGDTTVYSIVVGNAGPNDVSDVILKDPASPNLNCTQVSCSASGNAVCPVAPSIAALQSPAGLTLPSLPVAGRLEIRVTCRVL